MTAGLQHLTGSVWLWPAHPDPARVQAAIGIVAGDTGSVIVDAGHSPALARTVQAAMNDEGLPPAELLVFTHHHWDHTWGACAWQVPVVAHERCAEFLAAEAAKPWSHDYLRAQTERNPRLRPSHLAKAQAIDDFAELRLVTPQRTFSDRLSVDAGGVRVDFEHVGGQHTADSTVVRVPGAGVLFLGDCYYPPAYHLRSPDDGPDVAMLAGLITEDVEWYVESHDAPRRRTELLALMPTE